jgi:hypothetical protein
VDDTLPFELGVLKVYENRKIQTCDGQIPGHLCRVVSVKAATTLGSSPGLSVFRTFVAAPDDLSTEFFVNQTH